MPTHIGIGFSQDANTAQAAQKAAQDAIKQVNQKKIDLVVVFSTIHYSPLETSHVLQTTFKNAEIIGCSTTGIILKDLVAMRGISILTIASDEIKFATAAVENITSKDATQAGVALAREVNKKIQEQRHAFLFFSNGLHKNNSLLIKGFEEVFGNAFPILGGGSSDDFHFKKTYQYYHEKVMTDGACGFLIGGNATLGMGNRHGWKPLGKPRIIDKAQGHIIESIDGKPAAKIYEEYFDEEAKSLTSSKLSTLAILYPLGIYIEDEGEYLLRNAVQVLDNGNIICQGNVAQGSEVHVMIGNKDSCKNAAIEAAQEVKKNLSGKMPSVVIIFESLARNKLLGRGAFNEIAAIKNILGQATPIIGMYSHGEISPLRSLKNIRNTHFQNESILIIGIR